jgi:hypothetical protein
MTTTTISDEREAERVTDCERCGKPGADTPDPTGDPGLYCAQCAPRNIEDQRKPVEIVLPAVHAGIFGEVAWDYVGLCADHLSHTATGHERTRAWAIEQLDAQVALARLCDDKLKRPLTDADQVAVKAPWSAIHSTVWAAYSLSVDTIHAESDCGTRLELGTVRSALDAAVVFANMIDEMERA